MGIDVNPRTKLKYLPITKQEMVVIAKAVHNKSKLMIFDELKVLLANEESEKLFETINKLKAEGIGIVYISI